jgi:uncharacterized protein (TIGR03437 family)
VINAEGTTHTPGVTQRISVTVSDPSNTRWGFQLTARQASNPASRAGTLTSVNPNTMVICSLANLREVPCADNPVLQFIEHNDAQRNNAPGSFTFSFDWTPPASDVGDIVLYAAGNAANGNQLETGDRIYTTTLTLNPRASGPPPAISEVIDGAGLLARIAPNGWVTIKGENLAGNTRIWEGRDFVGNKLPTRLDGVSVKINDQDAFVYYISPTQINALAPVDTATGPVSVQATYNGQISANATVTMQREVPAFFLFENSRQIAAVHTSGALLGPPTLYPGLTTPAAPGETILLFGSGFGPTTPPIVNGELLSGAPALSSPVTIRFGTSAPVTPAFAGLSATGLYQFNVRVPDDVPNGEAEVIATINGVSTPANARIAVQR